MSRDAFRLYVSVGLTARPVPSVTVHDNYNHKSLTNGSL